MANNVEIDSFTEKFKLLRDAGFEASLSFDNKLGEVSISLYCKVGIVSSPPSRWLFLGERSPSYCRRLERRKAERNSCNELHSFFFLYIRTSINGLRLSCS